MPLTNQIPLTSIFNGNVRSVSRWRERIDVPVYWNKRRHDNSTHCISSLEWTAEKSDGGVYICVVNHYRNSYETSMNISVYYPQEMSEFTIIDDTLRAFEETKMLIRSYTNMTLNCTAAGAHLPDGDNKKIETGFLLDGWKKWLLSSSTTSFMYVHLNNSNWYSVSPNTPECGDTTYECYTHIHKWNQTRWGNYHIILKSSKSRKIEFDVLHPPGVYNVRRINPTTLKCYITLAIALAAILVIQSHT